MGKRSWMKTGRPSLLLSSMTTSWVGADPEHAHYTLRS
uniref:Uncharacterized protein n=1 Tax=Arundo donax TaxID=35708 RepID=A0A0A9AT90_ARUDO